ncbi:MAG: NAD(P)H-dependent dehydrogenase/reductase [Desulfobacteraceae bacterium]|nr:MAG: NAD(P)H-dependent dehydrogenase/reductase [Desulfobacteraceae bacterium]
MFMSLIRKRRSIRVFQDRPVVKEKVDLILEAALRSPSSRGNNPWHFVVVTEKPMLAAIAQAKPHGASFLKDAPLGILVCADASKSDVWVEDAAIATLMIQLAAESLELGSCWIQFRERRQGETRTSEEYIAEQLRLPAGMKVLAAVAIGAPAESKKPRPAAELLRERVYAGSFGRPYF